MNHASIDAWRVRTPSRTWEVLEPALPRFGITRVGDVTRLDILGVPVAIAYRPLAATLSVSQGKGITLRHAFVSAAMEAVELWHAENPVPGPVLSAVPAGDLDLPYEISELDQYPGSLLTDRTPLDWVTAIGLVSGQEIPVPLDAVAFRQAAGWRPPGLRTSSNGLASGNNWAEAAVHGLIPAHPEGGATAARHHRTEAVGRHLGRRPPGTVLARHSPWLRRPRVRPTDLRRRP